MNYIDLKYCGWISSRLDGFVVKNTNPYMANFRCPFCGDSKKNQFKKRGWLLEKPNNIVYYCHNCTESKPNISSFLKSLDFQLYNSYIFEMRSENIFPQQVQISTKQESPSDKYKVNLNNIIKVSSKYMIS